MRLIKKSKIGFLACIILIFSLLVDPLSISAAQNPVGNADSGNTDEIHNSTNPDYVWTKPDETKGYRVSIVDKTTGARQGYCADID